MSKRETPMTRWYWQQIGGTLVEEFCVVPGSRTCGVRLLDGVIIKDAPFRIAGQNEVSIEGKDVVVIQAKIGRLGMSVMGETFFSAQLMQHLKPRSVNAVALVMRDDEILRPLLEQYPGMRVVVCPVQPSSTSLPDTVNPRGPKGK